MADEQAEMETPPEESPQQTEPVSADTDVQGAQDQNANVSKNENTDENQVATDAQQTSTGDLNTGTQDSQAPTEQQGGDQTETTPNESGEVTAASEEPSQKPESPSEDKKRTPTPEADQQDKQSPRSQGSARKASPTGDKPQSPQSGIPKPPTPTEDSLGRMAAPPPPEEALGRAPGASPAPQSPIPAPPEIPDDQQGRVPTASPVTSRSPEPELPAEPPRVPTAPPPPAPDSRGSEKETDSPNALDLTWSFGMSRSVPVINMTIDQRKMIGYACAHTGVLYDLQTNTQTLLQGHANAITATCVSGDHRWFATADIGQDNMIIVWDSYNGTPVRTIFDPHPDGVIAMAMTPDARYLASISAGGIEETQTLAIWDWTVEGETPLCTAELDPGYGLQNYILFNREDTTQIVTNSDSQVIFYSWKSGDIQYFAPPLCDDDFNKPVGKYSQSIFLGNSTRALTATSLGNLVVWDTNKPLTKVVNTEATPDKKALKLVKLQERGLNVLTTVDNFIVSGDALGHVKFFDQTLKLMNWYQDFHLGPINSLTFAHFPEFGSSIAGSNEFPPDATIKARKFIIRDFVIGTTNAVFAHCTTEGTNVEVIHRDHDSAVHGIDSHPTESKFVVGSYSGLLKIWDYEKKEVVVSRTFDRGSMIRCCAFDPNGDYIAVGFTNGTLRIVDALNLDDLLPKPFHYARDAITNIAFSHDSKYLATADAEYTTSVYVRDFRSDTPYVYLGRHRAHYKAINSILFGKQLDGEAPRLISLADDRHLVEYDLENSDRDELKVLNCERIEQSAVPLCMTWYPPITKESFLLTANDQFKSKLYNSTTKMCRKTLLAPTYGSPIQQMVVLPTADPVKDKRYLAYITEDKIGMQIMPLDGNPHNAMAMNAHPLGVARLVSSHDGKFLFTAGGVDNTVHMWKVNLNALEVQAQLGGADLIPFYGLLEGGREGDLFRELEDYFYYAQIRSQGVDTMESRETSTTVPVSEIPFVMRSLGFYPSEQEIEDMKNEVKYSDYVNTGEYTTTIDLGNLIKLYINHRPAFGLQSSRLQWAFDTLGLSTPQGPIIDRGDLLDILQNRGEHIKEYDLAEYLMTLLGHTEEGGNSEQHQFDTAQAGNLIDQSLPQDVTMDMFADDLLGFGLYNSNVLAVEEGATPQEQPA